MVVDLDRRSFDISSLLLLPARSFSQVDVSEHFVEWGVDVDRGHGAYDTLLAFVLEGER
jgi:hypothetical protein